MGVSIEARWIAAQVGERRFHVDVVPEWGHQADPEVRRVRERMMRQWYRGMLDLPEYRWVSVTDYGCGPQSLLLDIPGASDVTAMAVDPLKFTADDETRYRVNCVQRYIGAAEYYEGPVTQEGWMYNCLQHTMDWRKALTTALRHTSDVFRLFEWVEVPTDALHLHTLHEPELRSVLTAAGFTEMGMVRGEFTRGKCTPSAFYAGIWQRVSSGQLDGSA